MRAELLNTNCEQQMLVVPVQTRGKQMISLVVRDWKKPNTEYARRKLEINGTAKFLVRMPQSPEMAQVCVFNSREKKGQNLNSTFKLGKIIAEELKNKFDVDQIENAKIRSFVYFAQKFSERCGILDPHNAVYTSNDGKFVVNYYPVIATRDNGKQLATPSRISKTTREIDVSKKYFDTYTVPMRMAILMHEFAHMYMNRDASNETEADINAMKVLLGLGYSRIEIAKVFLKVFHNTPTNSNKERYKVIEQFLQNYERNGQKFNNKYYYTDEL